MIDTIPVPKYKLGQQVWFVRTNQTEERWPCPDCQDTRVWQARSAAGEEVPIACPRCQTGNVGRDVPSLYRRIALTDVRSLTIGSVRLDTANHDRHPVSYMCVETGVGSGSVYYETELYPTEAEARAIAEERKRAEQARLDVAPVALLAKEYSYITYRVALVRAWEETLYDAYDRARQYEQGIKDVLADEDLPEQLRDRLAEILEPQTWRRPQPLAVLVEAARVVAARIQPNTQEDAYLLQQLAEALKPLEAPETRNEQAA